ncbi:MAG: MraY family glycosyltransferase [Armatimonadota bacterium]
MNYNFLFIAAFLGSLIITVLVTPAVKKAAEKHKLLDAPAARKVHKKPIPLGGGVAVYLGFFLTVLLLIAFIMFHSHGSFSVGNVAGTVNKLIGLFICGTTILIIGLIDDKKNLSAKIKLLFQICIACALYYFGFSIDFISLPQVKILYLNKGISLVLTLIWIVGLTNALNFLDGLDGLLCGVTAISAVAFAVITASKGQMAVTVLMLALAGSALGFLKYNFYPAKIFLGDGGSLFIGMVFSSLSIMGAFKVAATMVFIIPIIIMGIPIFDTTYAVTRRMFKGQSIFKADKEHLHHKLLNMGLSHKKVVLTIYIINALLCLFGLYIVFT